MRREAPPAEGEPLMGAGNVRRVYERWPALPHLQFRTLAYMALRSLDSDDPPTFRGGWETLARAMGREVPEDPHPDSPRGKGCTEHDDCKARRAALVAVNTVTRDLTRRSAVGVVRRAAPGVTTTFALNLGDGTVQDQPAPNGAGSAVSTVQDQPSNGAGSPTSTVQGEPAPPEYVEDCEQGDARVREVTDDDIRAEIRRRKGPASADALIDHIFREDGPRIRAELRAKREKAATKRANIERLKRQPCEHGERGGDSLHPSSGVPWCPLCRMKARRSA